MIDFEAFMLDPLYDTLGVPATIVLPMASSDDDEFTNTITGLTVIDKTGQFIQGDHDTTVATIEPSCCIRASELALYALTISDIDGATIEFNGSRWLIKGELKRPTPNGARKGEVQLVLGNETEVDSSI